MRKVFISNIIMGAISDIPYKSRDLELNEKSFSVPICYLMDANIGPGDEVLVITGLTQTKRILENYEKIKKEMEDILAAHQHVCHGGRAGRLRGAGQAGFSDVQRVHEGDFRLGP